MPQNRLFKFLSKLNKNTMLSAAMTVHKTHFVIITFKEYDRPYGRLIFYAVSQLFSNDYWNVGVIFLLPTQC